MNVSDLCSARAEPLARGGCLALDESSIGGEVLNALESGEVVDLVKNGHGENLADSWDGAKEEEARGIVDLDLLSEKGLEILNEAIVVTSELDIGGDALEDRRVEKLLGNALSISDEVNQDWRSPGPDRYSERSLISTRTACRTRSSCWYGRTMEPSG